MAHRFSPLLQKSSSASPSSTSVTQSTSKQMIDTLCIHGDLRRACRYCDLRFAPGLIENIGAHCFEPTAVKSPVAATEKGMLSIAKCHSETRNINVDVSSCFK
jgi:hypothetical protein